MHSIVFKDKLLLSFKTQLENVFYFNAYQKKYFLEIEKSNEKYGLPIIEELEDTYIQLNFLKTFDDKKLYAIDEDSERGSLLGVLAYIIKDNICEIFHIAVNENCTLNGPLKNESITFRLIEKLRKILSLNQIEFMKLPYKNTILNIKKRIINTYV